LGGPWPEARTAATLAAMVITLLGLEETALNQFLLLAIGGLIAYLGVSGLSYLVFFVWGRRYFHPTYVADPKVLREQIQWGLYGTLGNAVLTVPFHWGIANGYSQIYWDPMERGLGYLLLSIVLYLVFTETCVYWVHRALHKGWLFKHIHKPHHKWRESTSFVSMAFHPLDSFAQAIPTHVFAFLLPLNAWVYLVVLAFIMTWTIMIHDRVSVVRGGIINHCNHHTLHHWYFRVNYGQFFTFWDRLMGTWMDPEAEYYRGKVPEDLMRWAPPLPPRSSKTQGIAAPSSGPTEQEVLADVRVTEG
jgi:lathosterol oxidase